MLVAMLVVGVYAKSYPTSYMTEWTGVVANSVNATRGWSMDGNFYVVQDSQDADMKFGIAMGASPPTAYSWVVGSIYQSYI